MNSMANGKANVVETVEINILDLAIAESTRREEKTALAAAPSVKPTVAQVAEITQLRGIAALRGGVALALAQSKCNGNRAAAEQYIALLKIAIEASPAPVETAVEIPAPVSVPLTTAVETPAARVARKTAGPIVGAKATTAKQWAYIKHLRGKLYGIGEGWSLGMAKRSIDNNSRAASAYIKDMISALRRRFESSAAARTGGRVCSICWQQGCNIGPMVQRS